MNRFKLSKAGVNVNDALLRLGNDKELYEQLLKLFKNETHFKALEDALKSGDASSAFAAAHAIKGESGNMGFFRLYESICPLVYKLNTGDLTGTEEMLAAAREVYLALIDAIG